MQFLTYLLSFLLVLFVDQATPTAAFPFHDVAHPLAFADAGRPTDGFDAISIPTEGQVLSVGETIDITWFPTPEYNNQTMTIILMQGNNSSTLQLGKNVASGIQSGTGTYSWEIDDSLLGFTCYGLELQLDSNSSIFQWSFPFNITSGKNGTNFLTTTRAAPSSAPTSLPASITSDPQTSSTTDIWTLPPADSDLTSAPPAAWTTNSCWSSWISAGNPSWLPPPCVDTLTSTTTLPTETITTSGVPAVRTGTPTREWNTSSIMTTMVG